MLQDNLNPVVEGVAPETLSTAPGQVSTRPAPPPEVPLIQRLLNSMFDPNMSKAAVMQIIQEVEQWQLTAMQLRQEVDAKDMALKGALRQLEELKAQVDAAAPKKSAPPVEDAHAVVPVEEAFGSTEAAVDVPVAAPSEPDDVDVDYSTGFNIPEPERPRKKSGLYK